MKTTQVHTQNLKKNQGRVRKGGGKIWENDGATGKRDLLDGGLREKKIGLSRDSQVSREGNWGGQEV